MYLPGPATGNFIIKWDCPSLTLSFSLSILPVAELNLTSTTRLFLFFFERFFCPAIRRRRRVVEYPVYLRFPAIRFFRCVSVHVCVWVCDRSDSTASDFHNIPKSLNYMFCYQTRSGADKKETSMLFDSTLSVTFLGFRR